MSAKEYLDGFMHVQISTNSTNEEQRRELFGGENVVTIEEMKQHFNNMPNNNRLITLNFILGSGWELNPDKLYGLDPKVFCVKLTPLNVTTRTVENGLEDAIKWNWDNMYKIRDSIQDKCGLKVVVDVAAKTELPLCCGNLVHDYKAHKA
jgi:adenine C2-methylase RlmN of 23S rRNA A2503 and tRNA A37